MKVIYVYCNKGGVGKSTVAVNTAFALKKCGYSVGLFDADIYGPNLYSMVSKITTKKPIMKKYSILPGEYDGLKINSLSMIIGEREASFWSGKYLEGLFYQLLYSINWDIDYLIIDLPPGSGEIHRNLFTHLKGKALLVTTPQELSFNDTVRGIEMLAKYQVDILGVVENMAYALCEHCGKKFSIFGQDTNERICKPFKIPLLLRIPISKEIVFSSQKGKPAIYLNQTLEKKFRNLANKIVKNNYKLNNLRIVA